MKCIKIGNQIASLEDVRDVSHGSSVNSIRITYKTGYMIPSSQRFAHHSTELHYVKNVDAVMNEIFKILTKED